jgi:hypothetical protein
MNVVLEGPSNDVEFILKLFNCHLLVADTIYIP